MSGDRTRATFLVTGGAGFIGSHLVDDLLAAGHHVRVLDDLSTGRPENLDPRAELRVGDVADRATAAECVAGMAGVFHLAAVSSVARGNEDWPGAHRINQSGTVAVLDAARAAGGVAVVYASSAAVYGDTGAAAAHEDLAPNPMSAYGADKLGSEWHARIASRVHGVATLGLRFFNVYGPRQEAGSPYSGVISIFTRNLASGEPIILHGDGGQTRDFVHVGDVVAHLRAAMARLHDTPEIGGTVLNVCTGRAIAVRELARLLGRLRARTPLIEHGPLRPGDIRHSRGSPERAAEVLGLRATIALEDGLASFQATMPSIGRHVDPER